MPSGLRLAITQGVHVAVWLIAIFVLMGALTVVVWIALYHDAVGKLFVLSEMGTSSRILTSLAAIVWLPNLIIWALSWLTGGGFYIGELASFTLWTGQGEALPPIPIFGLFPEAVTSSVQRIILLVLPTIVTGIVALLTLLTKRGFDMLASLRKQGLRQIDTRLVTTFLYSCISLVITGLIVLLALGLAFFCSNGDLGEHRLKGVGVHVTESAAVFARDISVGLLAPWLMLLLVSALVLLWNSTIDSLHRSVTLVSAVPASLNSYESSDKSQTRISGTDTSSQPSHTVQTVNKTSHSDAPGQSSGQ
ncbi:hypothetical protein KIMH_07920 [Bombiscardovia apis]|uniref:Uncharacterized protein n=1 Tax=Bombiscardovia apis TaxID=2932182 RepID=A0ABN6SIE1_9BIFI|nr:hypothetical protein KIMH_07920 [Bombiscardovia apis]